MIGASQFTGTKKKKKKRHRIRFGGSRGRRRQLSGRKSNKTKNKKKEIKMMGLLSVSIFLSPHIPMGTGAASFSSSGGPSYSASSILSRQPHVVAFRPPPSTFSVFGRSLLEHNNSKQRRGLQVVRMAPEEEKMTRRSPLDFPIVSYLLFISSSLFFKFVYNPQIFVILCLKAE